MKFIKYKKAWWRVKENSKIDNADIECYDYVCKHHMDLREFEIVEANDFNELDWSNTELLNPNSKFGWLDRDGNFYACDFACHEFQAMYIHKSDSVKLEDMGWIHISARAPDMLGTLFAHFYGDYKNGVIPTDAQLAYIVKRPDIKNIDSVKEAVEKGNYAKAKIYESKMSRNNIKDDGKEL